MIPPFQIQICDRNGHVVAAGNVSEILDGTFCGEMIRDDLPEELGDLLREYHVACESGALGCCGRVQQKLVAFELHVAGIPGKETPVRLRDFQLGPDGLFSLDVDCESQEGTK
jgi:hypothetical protein